MYCPTPDLCDVGIDSCSDTSNSKEGARCRCIIPNRIEVRLCGTEAIKVTVEAKCVSTPCWDQEWCAGIVCLGVVGREWSVSFDWVSRIDD